MLPKGRKGRFGFSALAGAVENQVNIRVSHNHIIIWEQVKNTDS